MTDKRQLPELLAGGVVIVGLGLIGGSIARSLREFSDEIVMTAVDIRRDPIERALADHMIRDGAELGDGQKVDELLAAAHFVILSLYPAGMIRFLVEHREAFRPGTVIMDLCGLKGDFVAEAQQAVPEGVEFVGAHPMAGREKTGYENGSAEMFLGATLILTPTEHNRPETVQAMYELARILGFARVRKVDPIEHDRLIAYTSQMPHVLAAVLMQAWSGDEGVQDFAGGGFRDTTRIADINEDLWAELFMMNSAALTEALRDFSLSYGEFLSLMEAGDYRGMREFLKRSGDRKRRWNQANARSEWGLGGCEDGE